MKQKLRYIVAGVTICLCILFCSLWLFERNAQNEMKRLCQYSAHRTAARFASYRETGSEYDYSYGVAELVSFYNAYTMLVTNSKDATDMNCISLNRLIGVLMDRQELSREQIDCITKAMHQLEQNAFDENAYIGLDSVYFALTK